MKDFETIDFVREREAIKLEFGPRYYADDAATQKAADFWGAKCNPHGVIEGYTTETIAQAGGCSGKLDFAQTSKGYWLIGAHTQTPVSGMGYAPSVWDTCAYCSYHDARLAGIAIISDFFKNTAGNASPSLAADIRKILEQLRAEETPQLTLF